MPLPSEYVIEDAVKSIDDVIVYRAVHPIHGTVNVYLPDETLPSNIAAPVKKHLYQDGRRMRNISLMDIGFVTKALEVSQNPKDPYIVTKYAEHDLDEFISNGLVVKPVRLFTILSQILQALINLNANGWAIERLHPRQIKLPKLDSGDISLTIIESQRQTIETSSGTDTDTATAEPDETITVQEEDASGHTPMSEKSDSVSNTKKQSEIFQRDINLLGNIAYQLLFSRQYLASDKTSSANIRKLPGRWRKILNKALAHDTAAQYDTYEAMLANVTRALNRNKRAAIASIPFVLLAVAVISYSGYRRYHRYKIMNSEAGQAIESFLEIVNETDDQTAPLDKPEAQEPVADEEAILKPFEEIESEDKD